MPRTHAAPTPHPLARAGEGRGMSPELFDRLSRALSRGFSRRSLAVAAVVAAPSLSVARPRRKSGRRDKSEKRKKGDKKGKSKSCQNTYSEQQIIRFIGKAARKYGQSKKVMLRVARCESNLDPCAVNRSGPYYGLYQYLKSTWKTTPYGDESIWDPEAQAMATGWMWKQGRKNEWVCQ
jgi:hypothetical protein